MQNSTLTIHGIVNYLDWTMKQCCQACANTKCYRCNFLSFTTNIVLNSYIHFWTKGTIFFFQLFFYVVWFIHVSRWLCNSKWSQGKSFEPRNQSWTWIQKGENNLCTFFPWYLFWAWIFPSFFSYFLILLVLIC